MRRWIPSLLTHSWAKHSTADLDLRIDDEQSDLTNNTNGRGEVSLSSSSSSLTLLSYQVRSSSFIKRKLSTASSSFGSSRPNFTSLSMRSDILPYEMVFFFFSRVLSSPQDDTFNFPSLASRTKCPNSAALRSSSGLIAGATSTPPSSSLGVLVAAKSTTDASTNLRTDAKASSSISANPHDSECANAMATVSCIPMVHLHGRTEGVDDAPPPISSSLLRPVAPKKLPPP
mmetsp:Transcript_5405/g.8306  ORF Transcript_5405/g.8306 Transcript_5405/m.8306 type:complete len:230 (-) Transcript_5405:243-932(-)